MKGVYYCKRQNMWRARISYQKKRINIGLYKTFEEAKVARNKKAKELFGAFTHRCELG
jgi:hypothetical protein